MPTVYLPLGSQAASGKMGEMFVYQGVTVRAWVVPTDPRTEAQIDQRHLFYDVTKTERVAGTWVKAALKTSFGSRWFTQVFHLVVGDSKGLWAQYDSDFDALSEDDKIAWDAAAPFLATWNRPGWVFWMVAKYLFALFDSQGETFEMPEPSFSLPGDVATWWGKTLDGVFTHGVFEDTDSGFAYDGSGWGSVSAAEASGGSYKETAQGTNASVMFYFYGVQAIIRYTARPGGIAVAYQAELVGEVEFSQYAASITYQNEFIGATRIKGLHRVTLLGMQGTYFSFDGVQIKGSAPRTSIPKVVGANFAVGVLDMAEQSGQPPTPEDANSKLYFLDDGKLYKLASDGAPVEIVPGAITQGEADLLYAALVHTHKQSDVWGAHGLLGTIAAGGTGYLVMMSAGLQSAEALLGYPRAATLKNLMFRIGSAQPGTGTLVGTLRKNGQNTALVVTIPAGGGVATYSDTTNSVSIAAGDRIGLSIKNNASSASAQIGFFTVEIEFDTH